MPLDANGRELFAGNRVTMLQPDKTWFSYLTADAYAILQAACKAPLTLAYLDDDARIALELPPTLESDGDYVTHSRTVNASAVLLVAA